MTTKLVLGIGNVLLCDEGCGVHVIQHLQQHHGGPWPDVAFVDGGTLGFNLAAYIEAATQLIIVDAAHLDAEPGSVQIFVQAEMDRFLGSGKRSVHEIGLLDLLDIARLTGHLPGKRALVGIQPERIAWGDRPTPTLAAAIPNAAVQVLTLLNDWASQPHPHPQPG